MPIIEPSIRPPQEADSFLLQVTTGCSANTCSFCGVYKGKPFTVKPRYEIASDIKEYSARFPESKRVFLMDGDALILNNHKLIPILQDISTHLPLVRRISSYANDFNILSRSDKEIIELYNNKLRCIYIGLESGYQKILTKCRKKSTVHGMVTAVRRAQNNGIKASVIVLLGLGGRKYSEEHTKETVKALNAMQPVYLSFLTLMLIPGTSLYTEAMKGNFDILSSREILEEMYRIIEGLQLDQTIFRSNHASNYLPLAGRLPQDKKKILSIIKKTLQKETLPKAESVRRL